MVIYWERASHTVRISIVKLELRVLLVQSSVVVVGDLGPQIIAKMFDLNQTSTLRSYVMIFVTIACVIPLGLLRNVDSLAAVCTASIGFYFCLVLKVFDFQFSWT